MEGLATPHGRDEEWFYRQTQGGRGIGDCGGSSVVEKALKNSKESAASPVAASTAQAFPLAQLDGRSAYASDPPWLGEGVTWDDGSLFAAFRFPSAPASSPVTTQIALLRAVNVGGKSKVSMGDLRQLLADVGMENPRTLLQTGNLVFGSPTAVAFDLEQLLETEMEQRLELRTDILVRGVTELSSVIAQNPFPQLAEQDPTHLVVVFLKSAPDDESVRALDAASGPEQVSAWGRQLYATYPEGIGRSRLTMSLIERQAGTRGTARNWNTVLKLAALANG